MSEEQNLHDEEWIDKLDAPTMRAFNVLRADKTLQASVKKGVILEASRVVRRLMKQSGHALTPPEACNLTDAIIDIRWILDDWKPVLGVVPQEE